MYSSRGNSQGWTRGRRGGYPGPGRGDRSIAGIKNYSRPEKNRSPSPPSGPTIEIINKEHLEGSAKQHGKALRIEDCEVAASYSWLDKKQPEILVPGKSVP